MLARIAPAPAAATGALPLALALALATLGCSPPVHGTGDGGAPGTGPGATGVDGGPPTAMGAGCVQDPQSGTTLCAAISLCPSLVVNRDAFPNCGFRIQGQTLDLECDCNGAICPIGTPVTCTQAQQLLDAQQSETTVCTQVSEGRCTQGAPSPTPTGTGTGTGTCDSTCRSMCAGDPNCFKLCGC